MKREEQIKQAAKEYADDSPDKVQSIIAQVGFEMGAEWADAHPCWISVADELPPIRKGVIAYNGVTSRKAWVLEDGSWIAETHKEWERNCFKQYPVTHWMPVPALPMEIRGNQGKISPNHIIGTEEHIKVALDVLDKKGGEQ